MLVIVSALSVTIAAVFLLNYYEYELARFRWAGLDNDRNAHYLLGLSLALDVRHFDLKSLLVDLDGARVWPPLLNGFDPSFHDNKSSFQKWLQTTRSDTVVLIDIPPQTPFYFRTEDYYQHLRELLWSQNVFQPFLHKAFPASGCTVTLWRRTLRGPPHNEAPSAPPQGRGLN